MSEYPKWNDNERELLRIIAVNTAELADGEAGDVASIVGGNGISVDQPTGVVEISLEDVVVVTTSVSTARFLAGNGTAAAPSYSFTSDPDTGLFLVAANQIGVALNGAQFFRFATDGGIYGGTVNNFVRLPAAGAVELTAAGTNQNITLTPSGTGNIRTIDGTTGSPSYSFTNDPDSGFYLFAATPGNIGVSINGTTYWRFNGSSLQSQAAADLQMIGLNLASTSTNRASLVNTTAATAGVPVQMSPNLRFRGTAWDTSASQTVDFFIENLPASAATPTGTLKFGYSLNGAAATYPMTLTSAGLLTVGALTATGNVILGGGSGTALFVQGGTQNAYNFGPAQRVQPGVNSSGPTGWGYSINNASPFWLFGFPTSSTTYTIGTNTGGYNNDPTSTFLSITNAGVVTIPNLAGSGTRAVVADANGVLSAP